jgi:glycosyltransferase involved in cell wall biosynthesis
MVKRSRKIIFINRFFYPDISATSQILSDLAFSLAQQGYDIKIVTSQMRYDKPECKLAANEIIKDVKIKRIKTTRFGRASLLGRGVDYLSFYISCFIELMLSVNKDTIVVAKTDPPLISVIAALAIFFKRGILINWVQDLFPEVADKLGVHILQGKLGCCIKYLRNISLRIAEKNVVLGFKMKEYICNEGLNSGQVEIIPNWSDISLEDNEKKTSLDLREKWDLRNKFVIGYSGNMGRAHEFDTIIDVADKLKDFNDIRFLFIGDGAKKQYIEERIHNLKLENFIFKDYQPREQLVNSLTVPDIHLISLLPELEGFIVPSKFYGIAAVAKPTLFIGSQTGELSSLLEKHQAGFSVKVGDSDKAVNIIMELYDDSSKVEELGNNAHIAYKNYYTREKATENWQLILDSVV